MVLVILVLEMVPSYLFNFLVFYYSTCSLDLILKDVLSPSLTKNVISHRKLTADNYCTVEFTPNGFCVKDLEMKKNLLNSTSRESLYPLHGFVRTFAPLGLVAGRITHSLWHCRLGHANSRVLSTLSQ